MSLTVSPHDEFGRLLGLLFDGDLSPEEGTRLTRILRENDEARRYYVRMAAIHARLSTCCSPGSPATPSASGAGIAPDLTDTLPPSVTEPQAKSAPPPPPLLIEVLQNLGDVMLRPLPFTLIIMLIALLPLVGLFMVRVAPERPRLAKAVAKPTSVATVSRQTADVRWDRSGNSPKLGATLRQGQTLSLASGVAEIKFASGATVLLRSPARFVLEGPNAGNLIAGELTARVSSQAHGFAVQTPEATVIDLGTEFGVSVAGDGTVEAHVFKGEIEVAAGKTPSKTSAIKRLGVGQAARVAPAPIGQAPRIVTFEAAPGRFVRELPPESPPRPTIRYAHRGGVDPETEGWRLQVYQDRSSVDPKANRPRMAAVREDGVDGWMIENVTKGREIIFKLGRKDGLTDEIAKQAKTNGWTMRARIKLPPQATKGTVGCNFTYCNNGRSWGIFPELMADGNQRLILRGRSSLGDDKAVVIPNSRNRFIDYELRYNPATRTATVFADGRQVATGFYKLEKTGFPEGLQFGLHKRRQSKAVFAELEWKLLSGQDKPSGQKRGN